MPKRTIYIVLEVEIDAPGDAETETIEALALQEVHDENWRYAWLDGKSDLGSMRHG